MSGWEAGPPVVRRARDVRACPRAQTDRPGGAAAAADRASAQHEFVAPWRAVTQLAPAGGKRVPVIIQSRDGRAPVVVACEMTPTHRRMSSVPAPGRRS